MLETSVQYIQSRFIDGSWKKSLAAGRFTSWESHLVLLELMTMRSVDRTAHFGKVHGIALVSLRDRKQQVYQIATNPENLVVHGGEKGVVRGAGSALIRHVCHEIIVNERCTTKLLKLRAVQSALSFYKGFESFYKTLSPKGKPRFATIMQALKACGFEIEFHQVHLKSA